MNAPHRVDVHQHVVPPFWTEALPSHGGDPSGARAGDALYVSGTLGEAEHGLRLLQKTRGKVNRKNFALRKHLYPEPRVELGR